AGGFVYAVSGCPARALPRANTSPKRQRGSTSPRAPSLALRACVGSRQPTRAGLPLLRLRVEIPDQRLDLLLTGAGRAGVVVTVADVEDFPAIFVGRVDDEGDVGDVPLHGDQTEIFHLHGEFRPVRLRLDELVAEQADLLGFGTRRLDDGSARLG